MLPSAPLPRTLCVLAVVLLAPVARLHAQGHETIADQREAQVDLRLRGFNRRVLLDSMAVWTNLTRPPRRVLADARAILDSLGIPVTKADTLGGVIYDNQLATRRLVPNQRMSTYLSCGWGLSGDHADDWRVSMGYAVYVRPASGGSRLGVAIAGSATDVEGTSKAPVVCASTGAFELLIASLVAQRGH